MSAALAFEAVGVRLSGTLVVDGVTASLPAGRLVALLGPNGAGKTSLLRAACGLVAHDGDIHIEGRPAVSIQPAERARRMGYLPQRHEAHWPMAARDIVALGRYPHGARDPARLRPADAEAVAEALEATGATAFADRPFTALSGGERARVALARVIAGAPAIILADEPTAALDPRYQIETMALLKSLAAKGALVVAVTHDLTLAARFADQVLLMKSGRLIASGDVEAALSPERLKEAFGVTPFIGEKDGERVIAPWSVA